MYHHPWKQIISDYHSSGLSKCKFIDQYNQAHPEAKISRLWNSCWRRHWFQPYRHLHFFTILHW